MEANEIWLLYVVHGQRITMLLVCVVKYKWYVANAKGKHRTRQNDHAKAKDFVCAFFYFCLAFFQYCLAESKKCIGENKMNE